MTGMASKCMPELVEEADEFSEETCAARSWRRRRHVPAAAWVAVLLGVALLSIAAVLTVAARDGNGVPAAAPLPLELQGLEAEGPGASPKPRPAPKPKAGPAPTRLAGRVAPRQREGMPADLPREATEPFEVGKLVSKHTGMCLDWGDVIVTQSNCNATVKEQRWGDSPWPRRLMTSDFRCLDTSGKFPHVWQCNGGAAKQRWGFDDKTGHIVLDSSSTGQRRLASAHVEETCLACDDAGITTEPCDPAAPSQQWEFRGFEAGATGPSKVDPLAYLAPTIPGWKAGHVVNDHTQRCLDWGATIASTVPCDSLRGQQIWMYSEHKRVLQSRNLTCLDSSGKYIHVWKCHDDKQTQQWDFATDTGLIYQATVDGFRCLEANRTALFVETCDPDKKMQRWRLGSIFPSSQAVSSKDKVVVMAVTG
uniref:Ricin B lectin domain-containing protein n=1 Tax=Pyrodinium bahamense TaxID=73915 RepID=A0A7S0AXM8_9DINO|mmetsp:Transcript_44216/g.122940  ORF Transcript_44216/g.122940 Transcript_44216/m.122940 type:complete len:422 (+) Transcript_44216:61-1326(+)